MKVVSIASRKVPSDAGTTPVVTPPVVTPIVLGWVDVNPETWLAGNDWGTLNDNAQEKAKTEAPSIKPDVDYGQKVWNDFINELVTIIVVQIQQRQQGCWSLLYVLFQNSTQYYFYWNLVGSS